MNGVMKSTLITCGLLILIGCAQTPVNPELTLTEAVVLPLTDVKIILSGGTIDEPWIVFETEERVVLKDGENYQVFDPQPAYGFFSSKIPEENLGNADDFVCLARREVKGDSDTGAYLLFIPGSGVYHYRLW